MSYSAGSTGSYFPLQPMAGDSSNPSGSAGGGGGGGGRGGGGSRASRSTGSISPTGSASQSMDSKARRRERNRLAASAFRSRKKERLEVLEGRLGVLEGENKGLKDEVGRLRGMLKELGAAAAMSGLGVVPSGDDGLLVMARQPGEQPPPNIQAHLASHNDNYHNHASSSAPAPPPPASSSNGSGRPKRATRSKVVIKAEKSDDDDDDDDEDAEGELEEAPAASSHQSMLDPALFEALLPSYGGVQSASQASTSQLRSGGESSKRSSKRRASPPPPTSSAPPPTKANRSAGGGPSARNAPNFINNAHQPIHLRRLPSASSLLRTSTIANETSDGDSQSPDVPLTHMPSGNMAPVMTSSAPISSLPDPYGNMTNPRLTMPPPLPFSLPLSLTPGSVGNFALTPGGRFLPGSPFPSSPFGMSMGVAVSDVRSTPSPGGFEHGWGRQ